MALLNETGLSYLWSKIKALLNNKSDVGHSHSYTELSNKPTIPTMPTALSQLSDDSTHRVVTDTEKATWNAKSNFSGSYNDLSNKPTIPTIPSSLPANGGNADTVDNYHIRTGTSGASGYITFVI
jgi:hypothetical protein